MTQQQQQQQHHLNHATWECKYHVVFIPKYRKKTIFGAIKKRLGDVFHDLARRRECKARNFTGHKFWARGYFVSKVGRDEETIRAYIKNQELQDREMDQLSLIR
jgi:putative transposase